MTTNNDNTGAASTLTETAGSLFKVRVTFETVVLADSSKEATDLFKWGMGEVDDPPVEVCCDKVESIAQLPKRWEGRCLPWGKLNVKNKTVRQILTENERGMARDASNQQDG
jgi:hypothetical protein